MTERNPDNGLPKDIGRRLSPSLRKQIRQQKSQDETPAVNVRDRAISQARILYSDINRRLKEGHLSPNEEAILRYKQIWFRSRIPGLPPEDTISFDERKQELTKLLDQPEAGAYLKQEVQVGSDPKRMVTRAALLRDEIDRLLGPVTHRGHR